MSEITLYGFGPAYGLPDISPFVVKTMTVLTMAGLPFTINRRGYGNAPKGKLPYLQDGEQIIADSSFIYWHLEQKYALTLNAHLSAAQLAIAWAFEKMMEDHLYWAMLYERWINEANFQRGPKTYFRFLPWPLRELIPTLVRRKIGRSLQAQGMGRHQSAERIRLAQQDLDALADFLADKPFLLGEQVCSADATVFAFCQSAICPHFSGELQAYAASKGNIVAYVARMKEKYGL
ncbi:glutathione S-transferase family protein [Chitinibacter fontanus]|uniref:Glutathione S-transferase family protein n=1 Tax=Chitinibacter fontanus TaxID=1737446 RepID=A0A7D5V7C5_9NEIS|nr:glutathione S-transferase family protein [Chitinibacter fontanus]QLI80151.1 glutathione S-transferase family protein [Chitinibacter fontanus]